VNENVKYSVALFQSVSAAMKAESVLKNAGVSYKIIPVPKAISSECGICVRFAAEDGLRISGYLSAADIVFYLHEL
jgi:hypothetical protein